VTQRIFVDSNVLASRTIRDWLFLLHIDDHHVHAATLASRADKLLTSNDRDFPESDDLPYEIYTPDELLVLIDDSAPYHVRSVTREQIDYWQKRRDEGDAVKQLDEALRDADCPAFAERVRAHVIALAGAASAPSRSL